MKCKDCGHIADEAFFERERDVDENITVFFYNCPVCDSKEVSWDDKIKTNDSSYLHTN